jgi:hypothetical protein
VQPRPSSIPRPWTGALLIFAWLHAFSASGVRAEDSPSKATSTRDSGEAGDSSEADAPSEAGDSSEAEDSSEAGDSSEAEDSSEASTGDEDDAEAQRPPRRPVPNYDGRAPPSPTAGEVFLWVPRVLLFPLYLVSEYLLRVPLGFVVSRAEEEEIPEKVLDFFTFGPGNRGRWTPSFFFDFGFRPSVGFFFSYEDVPVDDTELLLHFATWGKSWLTGSVGNRIAPEGAPWSMTLRGTATRRPDGLFFGIGGATQEQQRSRYQFRQFDAELRFDTEPFWRASTVSLWAGVRDMQFSGQAEDVCCNGLPLADRVAQGDFASLPPGFEDGYLIYRQGARLTLDTRKERPHPGHGIRLELRGEQAFDLQGPVDRRWVSYGGAVGVHVDLTGDQNVLSFTLSADVAEPIEGEIPFTELIVISGSGGPLRGFVGRRLIGESAAAGIAEYRWPIWMWLDASVHVAVGNIYGGRFDSFSLDDSRLSFGVGVRSSRHRDHSFDLMLAFGTDQLDDGPDIESVRFVFGSSRAF